MVTALNELETGSRAEAGADDFISKPFSDDLLLAKVRSPLKLKQSRDGARGAEDRLSPT